MQKQKAQKTTPTSTTITDTNKYKCEKCKDREWVVVDLEGEQFAIECECKALRQFERSLKKAGLTELHKNMTFKNFSVNKNNKAMKLACIEYAKDLISKKKKSIIISGNIGSGKTHLAMAIANELIKKGIKVQYMDYRKYIIAIKQNMLDGDFYNQEINRMTYSDVLVIDDLFKGKITDSDINIIYEIVNTRYLDRAPVVITTEKSINQLLAIDEAIGSRLIEMSRGYVIHSYGENMRLKNGR